MEIHTARLKAVPLSKTKRLWRFGQDKNLLKAGFAGDPKRSG